MHELRIRVMDKDYEVLWDGESVIKGSDTKEPITYGNIGLKFTDCDINLYRIEVTEIKDEINEILITICWIITTRKSLIILLNNI